MSLSNATLTRVDPPPAAPASPTGSPAAAAPGPALPVRCLLVDPSAEVRREIDADELPSTAVLYVYRSAWPAAAAFLLLDGQVVVTPKGGPPRTLRIDRVDGQAFGSVSHVRCLVREA